MLREIYVRPVGLYPAARGDAAEEVWGGLRLAGGWLDFTAVEVAERNGARIERRIAGLGDFFERDWGRRALNAADMFELLQAPRPRLAGVALDRPRIMGVINVTPDSFSDGGKFGATEAAIAHGIKLVEDGADILDIGGESTRPGAAPVGREEELRRVIPVIEGLSDRVDALLSVDTRKADVMRRAVEAGADIINDVSALTFDRSSLETAGELGVPIVLMHAQGDPRTMQDAPSYDDVVLDVFDYLEARIDACQRAGITKDKIVIDPGIGFGKTIDHNLTLTSALSQFHGLGVALLYGASRKRFIGTLSGVEEAGARVHGSVAAALQAVSQGAQIVRVHDVAATRQALAVWQAVTSGERSV
ncbi:MAG TPA: dihydropteroate synthase [Hyphomicrobiaceae bacterium]|nr:dihydropteroate synthase [Hyphomicrobiaceae bacterium]